MTTQEKLQSIVTKFNLTCRQSTQEDSLFYLIDSDSNLVADFDTSSDIRGSRYFFCNYDQLPPNEITAIEQEWLKKSS